MKKKTAVLFFSFFVIIFTGNAQIINTHPYEYSFGVSGGTTFSSVTFTPKIPQQKLTGITFGLTGRMTMGENVGLQLELNYAQQGWNEYFEEIPEHKYQRRLNYIQMPFYTHVQFGGNTVKGFIHGGPQIGYLISESTSKNLTDETASAEQHDMSVENSFEWGISGGAGLELRTDIGYFLLEGRYSYSFGDIYGSAKKDYFSKSSSQVISVKVSYLIPVK